jgi:pimeloyl-ACP methyl ester carboxylesterase
MRRRACILALAAALGALLAASSQSSARAAGLAFTPCKPGSAFSCARLSVPLDRTGALSGTVTLSLERRLAGAAPTADAVLALAGGPGQAVLPLGDFIARALAPALHTRDLLLFDQRGTGSSDPLSCHALSSPGARAGREGALVSQCASELGPARGDYTTRESVADIEAVREAAGYEKLVLYGTSYGTKAALQYAARYPQHVEALVLDSTETPDGPEAFRVSTFEAMRPALQELCSHGACAGVTRNPAGDLARLVRRLAHGAPVAGRVYDGHGRPIRLSLSRSDLYGLMLAGDLDPALRAQVPGAVHAALAHDPGPLLRLVALGGVRSSEEESSGLDLTVFVATSCEETPFPWQRSASVGTRATEAEAALDALPRSDFYPFDPEAGLLDQTIPLCIDWPDAASAPAAAGPLPAVPTLILSGGQDLRTPTSNARTVAGLIPGAQLLTVPYTGHSVLGSDFSGCAESALTQFFAGTPVSACPTRANRFPPVRPAPRSLSSLTISGGLPGGAGRTLTASIQTLRDLERIVVLLGIAFGDVPVGAHFGGLRGGDARVTSSSVVIDHYSFLPGVQLSGTIPTGLLLRDRGSSSSLAVSGPAASRGRLRLAAGHRLAGVLAGRRFSIKLPSADAHAARGRGPAAGALEPTSRPSWALEPASLPIPRLARLP